MACFIAGLARGDLDFQGIAACPPEYGPEYPANCHMASPPSMLEGVAGDSHGKTGLLVKFRAEDFLQAGSGGRPGLPISPAE